MQTIGSGDMVFGSAAAERTLAYFTAADGPGGAAVPRATDREFEVLRLIAKGATNTVIARRLYL
jgi:DNA-binding NarL/FixJ family response regulator